jgi:parvulin-like peptidyl-prolyl isomerase
MSVALIYVASFYFYKKEKKSLIVAEINKTKIYKTDVEGKMMEVGMLAKTDYKALQNGVLENFVKDIYFTKILVSEAKKSKIKNIVLAKQNAVARDIYFDFLIKEKVTDSAIKNKYIEMRDDLSSKKEYKISSILVKLRLDAEKIVTILREKKRQDFELLAKKYSINKSASSNYLGENDILPEIYDVVSTMKSGDISSAIKTSSGFYIVKLNDVRDVKIVAFEDVKEKIKDELIKETAKKIYDEMFTGSSIKIYK